MKGNIKRLTIELDEDVFYALKEYFAAHPVEGKTILVKGSNGIKLPLIKEVL